MADADPPLRRDAPPAPAPAPPVAHGELRALPAARSELRAMAALAVPMALANLLQMAVYAIDVIFLAHLGQHALAAANLAVTVFMIQSWAFVTLTSAVSPLIAADLGRRAARHDPAADAAADLDIRVTMRMALWLAVGCGGLGIVTCSFGRALLLASGQAPGLADAAGAFLEVLRWAMIPMILGNTLRAYVSAMGRPVVATAITLVALIANGVGNWVLVFGHLGAPAMGMTGSAVANIVTSTVALLAYALAVWIDPGLHRPRVTVGWWRFDVGHLVKLVRIGVPMALTVVAEGGLFSSAALLMGRIGEAQLAAHAVALQVASFAFMLPMGIGQAATIRVGFHFGAGNRAGIARAGTTAVLVGLCCSLLTAGAMVLAPRAIMSAYLDVGAAGNARVVGFAVQFLAVAAAFQLADGAQAIMAGALRGLQDTRAPMLIALAGYWCVGFVVAAGLGLGTRLGGLGVWIGLAIGLAVVAASLLVRWRGRGRLGLERAVAAG